MLDRIIFEKKTSLEHLRGTFFEDKVLPVIENAAKTLDESDPSNEQLFLIVEHYLMPIELREEALDILLLRLAEVELRIIIKNGGIPSEIREKIALSLLDSLAEIRK